MKKSHILGKPLLQVGALPLRPLRDGSFEVLLVTTRSTKRWTVPKGWPIKKLKAQEAAAREATEEAGVIGHVHKKAVGRYLYWKRLENNFQLCKVRLYQMNVIEQLAHWPEEGERLRHWFKLKDAADLVEEPGVRKILSGLKAR